MNQAGENSRWLCRKASVVAASGVILIAVLASGSVAGASSRSPAKHVRATASVSSGVVTMAEGAQGTPNYIMPFVPGEYDALADTSLQEQMWPSLYSIGTPSNPNIINAAHSLANAPVYSDGDTVVTITLKPYRWSDGTSLTSRDVTFFMNLLKANKVSWAHYTPGNMPDNMTSWTAPNSSTVVFHLTRAYNPTWFTENQLAFIVPLPQQAWDKTSASAADGNYDETTAGAKAVFSFLTAQGKDTATYDTNPLWSVVDGPWRLKQYLNTGFVALVRNPNYSGPNKPHFSQFDMVPYTSATAEFNAVLSDSVSVGYVPDPDLGSESRVKTAGYQISRSEIEGVNMLSLNYHNPAIGPLVKQIYIRKALNDVMNEKQQISALLYGTGGYTDWGPIPPKPSSPYIGSAQQKDPYNIAAARSLLVSHGWKIPSSGAATCERPGTSSSECGAGILRGKTLTFSLVYVSGSGYLTGEMENYKSDASEVGIVLNLSSQPFNTIVGDICGNATCDSPSWQIDNWGAGFAQDFGVPDPNEAYMFEGHVGLDYPVPARMSALMTAVETDPESKTTGAMHAFDSYVVNQAPEVWQLMTYTVNAISTKLHNVVFYPTGQWFPQDWT